MRWIILCLALAGCSSAGGPSVWETAKGALLSGKDAEEAPKGKLTPPRAAIEQMNLALVQMNLEGEDVWPILQPQMRNGPRVVYANQTRQSLTLIESQVVGTRGLGWDLIAAQSSANDPLKRLTPPSEWPREVTRNYRFAGEGPEGDVLRYQCELKRDGEGQVQIAGTDFAVVRFVETCVGDGQDFTNFYDADQQTGRVWVSKQWIGPRMPLLNLEILEPLTQ